jgi:hypothetical protein
LAVVTRDSLGIAGRLRWRQQRWNGRDPHDPVVYVHAPIHNHPSDDTDATDYIHAASDNHAPTDNVSSTDDQYEYRRRR